MEKLQFIRFVYRVNIFSAFLGIENADKTCAGIKLINDFIIVVSKHYNHVKEAC